MKMYRWIIAGLLCMMSIGIYAVSRIVDINEQDIYSIQTAINASSRRYCSVYPGRYLENISINQKSNISVISLKHLQGTQHILNQHY